MSYSLQIVNNMAVVHVIDGELHEGCSSLPPGAVEDEGVWRDITAAELQEAGWFQVAEATRPADTAIQTYQATLQIVNGVPTQVWVERLKTVEEKKIDQETTIIELLRQNPSTHIDELRAAVTALETLRQMTNVAMNTEFNANPAAFLKKMLVPMIVIGRKEIRLAQLGLEVFDTTDGL